MPMPASRVPTFHNNGTLWCEKPAYIQLSLATRLLEETAEAYRGLLEMPTLKAAAAGDIGYSASLSSDIPTLPEFFFDTHAGMPHRDCEPLADDSLAHACHPRLDVPFDERVPCPGEGLKPSQESRKE